MNSEFLDVIEKRRSYYSLTDEPLISDGDLTELLKKALKYAPTAFNSQLTRMVLLLGGEHRDFWDIVMDCIIEANPGADMSDSRKKVSGFKSGYGTVLFYNDTDVTKALIEENPLYQTQFTTWAQHGNAMLQFAVWNTLEEAGFGASLQHYNPIIDDKVGERFNIAEIGPHLELIAQMPFGVTREELPDKDFLPIEKRFFVRE